MSSVSFSHSRADDVLPGAASAPSEQDVLGFEVALQVLRRLHAQKSRAYGTSWRKHGEIASIFANLSRKYDRLEAQDWQAQTQLTVDETLLDTVGDLALYSILYLTWLNSDGWDLDLVSLDPADPPLPAWPAVQEALDEADAVTTVCHLLTLVFRAEPRYHSALVSPLWCVTLATNAYQDLERVLVLGLGRPDMKWRIRFDAACDLAIASLVYLRHLGRVSPDAFAKWAQQWMPTQSALSASEEAAS